MKPTRSHSLLLVGLLALFGCADLASPEAAQIVQGQVLDVYEGQPVAFARVRSSAESSVLTDQDGRFAIRLQRPDSVLTIDADGYLTTERSARSGESELDVQLFLAAPSDEQVEQLMETRGLAQVVRDDPTDPALRPAAAAFLRGELSDAELRQQAGTLTAATENGVGVVRSALDAPPATVRIWRRSIDGASRSCAGRIDVIPLDEYIKGVLPHEWIPSWENNAFVAGSMAIRTYVWQWVSRGGKYDCADLDDTTRSQVYRDERLPRTSAAVDQTSGQAITRGGTLVSGEYSAENRDPTADGVADRLCAGRELFGHGRGMCQWGSQRWALDGQTPEWIATHYWPGSIIEGGSPAGPDYDAEYVIKDYPTDMVSGETAVVWIEFRNTGSTTWDLSGTRIGTTGPRDRPSRFYDAENWINDARPTGADHSGYGTGDVGRFTFLIRAPEVSATETIVETFGLVQEGIDWFGPEDISLTIQVVPASSSGVVDLDRDGSSSGADCDDSDPARYPGAVDICEDGIDQDCTGSDRRCDEPMPTPDGGTPEGTPGSGVDRRGGVTPSGCAASGGEPTAWALLSLLLLLARRRGTSLGR